MKKANHKTIRDSITDFEQIVNVGPSIADDFRRMGFKKPIELRGKDPWRLYTRISTIDRQVHDPCVLDTFMSAVDFMNGSPPRKWWKYTSDRKRIYAQRIARLKAGGK